MGDFRARRSNRWFRPFIEESKEANDFDVDAVANRAGGESESDSEVLSNTYLKSQKYSTQLNVVFLLLLSLLGLSVAIYESVVYQTPTTFAATALLAFVVVWLCVIRPRTGSVILVTFYIGVLICQAISIARSSVSGWTTVIAWNLLSSLMALVSILVVINMPLRDPSLSRTGISPPFSHPTKDLRSPEDNLTLWQWMSVTWMAPLIEIGGKRQLQDDDVWFLGYEFQHSRLHEAFRHVTGTVVRRLIKANWIDLVLLSILALIELAAQLAAPIVLQQLLRAMDFIDVQKRPALVYATALLALRLVGSQSGVFSLWFGRRCYERSRGEMITMLHEKVLQRKIIGAKFDDENGEKDTQNANGTTPTPNQDSDSDDEDATNETRGLLSKKSKSETSFFSKFHPFAVIFGICLPSRYKHKASDTKQPASMGKILNLMRNDVYETAQRFWEFQDLIEKPLGLILSVALTWQLVGWSCVVGIVTVIVTQIVNFLLARLFIKWETIRRQATDHKLQQISQYVETIRHLRWYGWHITMLDHVMTARQRELNLKIITNALDALIHFVNVLTSAVFPAVVFWAYTTLAGQRLSIDVAFPALQLFTILQSNLRAIPNLITVLINASVAVGRIEDFMSEPDIAPNNTSALKDRFELNAASFSWPGMQLAFLRNISLSLPQGLTLLVGPVASGKTALLQALLGELDLMDGELIRPDAPVAYCTQTPWLQSMTIRENILFGSPYLDARYRKVLDACALLPDLASFQHGDLSPIGENGIGLSGGQKARVALARALYSNARYLLLDDPISALDQQTAQWIVAKCFKSELLAGRTTVLVTHRVDLCEGLAVQRVEMSSGTARVYTEEFRGGSEDFSSNLSDNLTQEARQEQELAAIPEKFEEEEHRAHGGVQLMVYWEYVKAGRLRWWFLVILSLILWRTFDYSQNWFLKEWGEAYKTVQQSLIVLVQTVEGTLHTWGSTPLGRWLDKLPDPALNVKPWLKVFLVLVVIQSVLSIIRDIFMVVVTYNSGKNMFRDIMQSISNATFRFYDVTPVGRLMNRITGDIGIVDGAISRVLLDFSWQVINWLASIIVIASITPMFLVFSIVLSALFVFFFLRFLPTSQSLRRLEMVSLSPLMSNFGALLHGLITVRAFHAQAQFQSRVITVTDAFQKMDHFYWSLQAWLMYRFDTLSAVSTFILTLLAIYSGLSPGLTAFILIAAQKFVSSTHYLCKQYGQMQLDFVSVERVVELLHLEQETPGSIDPPASWPKPTGDIVFENVTVRYAPHLPPALRNVSFKIPGGSATAITGRTGSGKSTLALAILATVTPEEGRILIDGIDIAKVSKQALRTRTTFLAQEPVLFPGTLRSNLDPLSQHSDTECAVVLERVGSMRFSWTLDTPVDVGGKNLSQGQRQLVGLARALLRRSSIIIMDEATASIDLETSREVQRVLRSELVGSTVIGIAHRSSVVEDCNYVIKLAEGEVVGMDRPDLIDEGED